MAHHIIFIHGRDRKPWFKDTDVDFKDKRQIRASRECLRRLWRDALLVGLARHAPAETHRHWTRNDDKIHMAYYGDIFNVINGNKSDGICRDLRPTLNDLVHRTRPDAPRRSVRAFLQDRVSELAAFISQGLRFKDDVLLKKLDDFRAYVELHRIASRVRRRLHRILDPLLENRHRVAILGHSLGTLITYDVLWKISHRSEFSHLHRRDVDLNATLGCPLGNEAFLNDFRIDAKLDRESQFPRNIVSWQNFTARGDFVAHDARIRNDFRRRRFLQHLEVMKDHTGLFNPYVGRSGSWNPHKSFGYLLQEPLAEVIEGFTRLPLRQP